MWAAWRIHCVKEFPTWSPLTSLEYTMNVKFPILAPLRGLENMLCVEEFPNIALCLFPSEISFEKSKQLSIFQHFFKFQQMTQNFCPTVCRRCHTLHYYIWQGLKTLKVNFIYFIYLLVFMWKKLQRNNETIGSCLMANQPLWIT